jgi:signal transduction histidine kinase
MNNLFIKLFSQIDDGIVMFDVTGKVLYSNLEDSRFAAIVVDNKIVDDTVMHEVSEILTSKNNSVKKIKLNTSEQVENDSHAVLIPNDNMFCLYIRDELDKARFNILRENMFELINHELRTPMQGFLGGASLISEMLEENNGIINDTTDFQSLINMTVSNVKKVTTKVERLLELSQLYGDEPMHSNERIHLVELAFSAVDALQNMSASKNIIINVELKGEVIGALYGSFSWLKRAIEECVRNSIEHSHPHSEIHLQIKQNGNFAHIVIRDFGRGMAPKVKQILFDSFTGGGDKDEYSNQGLGIGLSLAKNIVEMHGGNIKNMENDDSVEFHIELPTGAGQSLNKSLDTQQAQLYAKDLAILMNNTLNKKT